MAGREYPLERTRSIRIMAHADTGKITTTERTLYCIGVNCKIGDTHEGTATMGWMTQEQERDITIASAATTCHRALQENYKPKPGALEHHINIIDTLGHADLTAEIECSLYVLGSTVGIFCTKGGIEPQSENVWRQVNTHNVPRMAFINKVGILDANFYGAVDQIKTRFDKNVVCIQLPIGKEDDLKGIIGLLEMKACIYNDDKGDGIFIIDIPEDMRDDVGLCRSGLVEKICELDDGLVVICLEGGEPSNDDLKKVLKKATCECAAIPACCGTAHRNKGVQKLLDIVIEFMPSPLNIPSIKDTDLDGNKVERHSPDNGPFAALAFRVMTDLFVGKLASLRVYLKGLNSGSYVLNAIKDKEEHVGRILQVHANKGNELDRVYSGDIVAAVGFRVTSIGDTVCDEKNSVILESMEFPEPIIDIVIEPKTKAGQDKMGDALVKLAEEDPTFHVRTDEETDRTIISGIGEFHLDIIVDHLSREFNVEVNVDAPQVAYKKTFIKTVDVDSKYVKRSGGRRQHGHCKVRFTPMETSAEKTSKFTSSVVGGAILKEYIPAVGESTEEACETDILGEFQVLSVHADMYDGSYHEVDSFKMTFRIAGFMTFREAIHEGNPTLLEPIIKVEATTPENCMGDAIGDINSRRECIEGMEDIGGGKTARAYVSLSEMFGYSMDFRSRTQGHGDYSMFFDKYEPVPRNVQEKVLSGHRK